jgi:peptidoglycan/xylan/chitin deacetylase (PgdA/CDA1 family)
MPLFAKYGARASFFPNGRLDSDALKALRRLYDAGHTVGPHTVHHRNATDVVSKAGFDAYWEKEVEPQMSAFASVGIRPRAMAYPNNRHSAVSDACFVARGITRLRAGVPNSRPYDPKGLKRASLVPFPKLHAMYLTPEYVRTNAVMPGVGIGAAYQTDIEDFCAGLRHAAARNETVVVFSHDICAKPNAISMKTEWLERILKTAAEEGMTVCGFDDLPALENGVVQP